MEGRAGNPTAPTRAEWWWILDPSRSLRARAALLVGGGTLALTFLLGWSTGLLYQRAIEHHFAGTFETLAFQVSDKLDRAVYERYRTLQLAASLAAIRDVAAGSAVRRNVLDAMQEATPEFAWIGVTDASGRVVASTRRIFEGETVENRGWFRNGRERPFVGPLRESAEFGRERPGSADDGRSSRFLDVAVPITGSDGQFAGVLGAQVRWNWAQEVQTSVIPESSTRELIGVTVYGANHEVLLDSGGSGWTQPPDAPPVGEGRRFRGWLLEHTAGGTRYLSGFARSRGFREYRGVGWLTVVRQPTDRLFAEVAPLRRTIIAWGTFLAIVAGTVAAILAGRHARRLRSVRASAERIREGDVLSVLPRPADPSELAAMCGALGDLVEDLRARQERLLAENARLAAQSRENEAAKR